MAARERHHVEITGAVQGVGFRPLVYRLATERNLGGWVRNSLSGLSIEIEGTPGDCADFLDRLRDEPPPNARITTLSVSQVNTTGEDGFEIHGSENDHGEGSTEILPDLATCADCLEEIFDPGNRRFGYPFTNCTQCGPRFSIFRSLPWDRERTTMQSFEMCPACREEFESPLDRRFHAQPIACPDCGPQLAFADGLHRIVAGRSEALERAACLVESGGILALKGVGGFQLIADARSSAVIERLRERKHRPAKPLALMLPDLASVKAHGEVSELEESLLVSPGAPIVLLRRRSGGGLPESLAPGNPLLGCLLPYSSLHHLLMRRLGFPVMATSGNFSGEPLCFENDEALQRLRDIADGFLLHDLSIARPVDDSVVRVAAGRELILRAARGYTPVSFGNAREPVLALGGDLKAAIAVAGPSGICCGPHIGDLETEAAREVLRKQVREFCGWSDLTPRAIACDLHPEYFGTRWAWKSGLPVLPVQHHHAHVAACLAEHEVDEEVLGVAWDGTGYGPDGTIWGGEFLLATQGDFQRVAHLRAFPLPGGERAIRQPRYAALGLLHEIGIAVEDVPPGAHFTKEEIAVARKQLERGIHAPITTSAGRLFEAVAALLGIRETNRFEAEAAMALEFAAGTVKDRDDGGSFPAPAACAGVLDWEPTLRALLAGRKNGTPISRLAALFVDSMSRLILEVARREGKSVVVLSGGCFQNVRLLERTVASLREEGFTPLWPRRVPPNDGGLALGQAVVASMRLAEESAP